MLPFFHFIWALGTIINVYPHSVFVMSMEALLTQDVCCVQTNHWGPHTLLRLPPDGVTPAALVGLLLASDAIILALLKLLARGLFCLFFSLICNLPWTITFIKYSKVLITSTLVTVLKCRDH